MNVDIKILISIVSVSFAIYAGIKSLSRSIKEDAGKDASQMTTVIVKLESIGSGISEIKAEMSSLKEDVKENRERLVKVEESTKQAHKRLDSLHPSERVG